MKHEMIANGRKRRARALEQELEEVLATVREGKGDPFALGAEAADIATALAATRNEPDDLVCFGCGTDVDPNDPAAGGAHFCRMSRHNETDKVVCKNTAEFKYCPSCYTALYNAITGQTVTTEREVLKAARAQKAAGSDHGPGRPDAPGRS